MTRFDVQETGDLCLSYDGTRRAPLNAMIRIAIGKDAAETAVAGPCGSVPSTGMEIYVHHEGDGEKLAPVPRVEVVESGRLLILR